ncbi:helix-turn-helix domain-containing protein [Eudoraea adriatica]|uniref:HTH domain-containing protein n=1 Tax=Eudoraea adriatica TaxID=446681 RepID=UPI0003715B84|nr:HTH domain-containing protein [Eudoraea adriatica]
MNKIKTLENLQKLHLLIEAECTGPPKALARRMELSERSVYNLLEVLKDFNAPVVYNRKRKTYYYGGHFKLDFRISLSVTNNNEVTELYRGSYLN